MMVNVIVKSSNNNQKGAGMLKLSTIIREIEKHLPNTLTDDIDISCIFAFYHRDNYITADISIIDQPIKRITVDSDETLQSLRIKLSELFANKGKGKA